MPRIKARSNLWIDGQRIEAGGFAELSEEQIRMLPKGFIYEMDNSIQGTLESTTIDSPAAAEAAALDLIRPFLRVPEAEAQITIAELLHGGPAELPAVSEPVAEKRSRKLRVQLDKEV
jgi:hypothetical protein